MKSMVGLAISLTTCLLALGVGDRNANAVLAETTLTSLIQDSDSIVRGWVASSTVARDGHGTATIEVEQVYSGWVPKRTISITWLGEPETQRLLTVGTEYVLFLKREGAEGVRPAQHGRSYWPIERVVRTDRKVTPLTGYLRIVKIDIPNLVVNVEVFVPVAFELKPVKVQAVPLDLLVPAIRTVRGNAAVLFNNRLKLTVRGRPTPESRSRSRAAA